MRRAWSILLTVTLMLSSCHATPDTPSAYGDVDHTIQHAAFAAIDHPVLYLDGTAIPLSPAPFLSDGTLFVCAEDLFTAFGGTVQQPMSGIWILSCDGNSAVVTTDYNVMLFNSDAVVTEATPILKNGQLCLPLSAAAQALSRPLSRGPACGLFAIGAETPLDEETLTAVRQQLKLPSYEILEDPPQKSRLHGLSDEALRQAAIDRKLWLTDARGTAQELWIDDGGQWQSKVHETFKAYPADTLYILEHGILTAADGTENGPSPAAVAQREWRDLTARYATLKAAAALCGDNRAAALSAHVRRFLCGESPSEALRADVASPYSPSPYGESWTVLVDRARIGDVLLFSSDGADDRYGYFNHAAMIADIDRETATLTLMHARNSDRGVGCDLPMDRLCEDSFQTEAYYQSYGTVFLCRVADADNDLAASAATEAVTRFSDYRFGVGGRTDKREINCTELITQSYRRIGVNLAADAPSTRLKSVLKGNSTAVAIPDDLLFDDSVAVIGVWTQT